MPMQILEEGHRNLVVKCMAVGTYTIDVSALNPPCQEVSILQVQYDFPGDATSSTIIWGATTDVDALAFHGHAETLDFRGFGGVTNNAGAGKTGDVDITVGDEDGFIVVWFKKVNTVAPL